MGLNKSNTVPCTRSLTDSQFGEFKTAIDQGYTYRLYVDDLPSAVIRKDLLAGSSEMKYDVGIPVGRIMKDENGREKHILYNHWLLTIKT